VTSFIVIIVTAHVGVIDQVHFKLELMYYLLY